MVFLTESFLTRKELSVKLFKNNLRVSRTPQFVPVAQKTAFFSYVSCQTNLTEFAAIITLFHKKDQRLVHCQD